MSVWFTSDQHFHHERIVELALRPFASTDEMDEHLVRVWNDRVGKRDIVYHLGDLAFTPNNLAAAIESLKSLKQRLNGEIRLLIGNHDDRRACEDVFETEWMPRGLWKIRHSGERIVICHYALRQWEGQHYGSWHLHGHSHGGLEPYGKSVDIGVDANFIERPGVEWGAPYSFEEIAPFMENRRIVNQAKAQRAKRR